MQSYLVFTFAMAVVTVVLLLFAVSFTSATVEITLGGLLLFLLLLVINVWLYGLWTATRITKPLEQIAGAMQQITHGRYDQRLHYEADYEFSVIQQRFNALAEALELAEADNRRLESSKQRMLADLSHDLKTPLTTIQGYTQALQLGLADNPEQSRRYLQLIEQKTKRMDSLIDDISSLSSLNSPGYPLLIAPNDLAELLRELAAEYYDLFEDKQFTFIMDVPEEELLLPCDFKLIRRAVSNLLTNALKHNPPGTQVEVKLRAAGYNVILSVADNGIGIADSLAESLFEPFVRGDDSRTSGGGTGLGLAITSTTAVLHGGELVLDRTGRTTCFRLTLPRYRPRDLE
ncbi:hypothetical protein B9T62_00675 [Paenibacillus donghaensis]|uniref:histidine kinase n=2 Tax=Paenibacillus donghaensis TaxID=414771 RepID=A0A2Z2KSW5_9BACL|nr:hypothetical protein B9T62_00675 [Paenibacillus donghaensis]